MQWIKARAKERTTLDGVVIIGMSVLVLIAAPIVKLLAWPALMIGIYALVSSEENERTED